MRQTKRLLLGILLLTSVSAFADSFTNLNVNFVVNPNTGSGGNIGGLISGQGVNLIASGGTVFSWFNGQGVGYAPGSIGGGGTTIFWDFVIGKIGSQSYGPGDLLVYPSSFNAGTFTFPTNGKDFTITMPASIGGITIVTICPFNCPTFDLETNPGKLTLTFAYSPTNGGGYYASSGYFTTTPEPSTLALLATGIGAVTWLKGKRKR
jgi:hypothetical protein